MGIDSYHEKKEVYEEELYNNLCSPYTICHPLSPGGRLA